MVVAFTAPAWATLSLESGSVSYGKGIHATGWWSRPSTELSWTITEEDGVYLYEYTWTTRSRALGDLILEVNPGAASSDFWGFSVSPEQGGPAIYSPGRWGIRNPGLREPMYGLEFEGSGRTLAVSFFSDLAPTWGDFYTKGGFWTYAYNSGFGRKPNGNGRFIPVPGVAAVHTPIPAAYILLGSGVAGLFALRRRTRFAG